ncbi:hypothetical protein niasHT_009275 [Heterodera trifolii]|uniref:Uncharacterized protein n=1 Tax=Heterodera trifolii TaxID=157864 RepID=A0ABD2MBX2_9BILA
MPFNRSVWPIDRRPSLCPSLSLFTFAPPDVQRNMHRSAADVRALLFHKMTVNREFSLFLGHWRAATLSRVHSVPPQQMGPIVVPVLLN